MVVINTPNGIYTANGWQTYPNPWGVGSLVDGVDYTDTITLNPATFPNGVQFNWSFPAASLTYAFVYAFPLIKYGEGVPGGPAPTQAADFTALDANYSLTIGGETAAFDVAFELWFSNASGTNVDEVMIQLHTLGAAFGGGLPGNQSYKLSNGGLTNASVSVYPHWAGSTETFTVIKDSIDSFTGTLSLSDIVKDLIWNGVLTGQEHVDGVQLGAESVGGSGSLTVNSLSYNWNANATHMGAAGGNETFTISTMGGNNIVGEGGNNTAVYSGSFSTFQIKQSGTETLITHNNDISTLDVLGDIQFIRFSNGTYDVPQETFIDTTSQIEGVYIAYYGRAGDPSGMNYWSTQLSAGNLSSQTLTSIAASFSVQLEAQVQYPFLANPLTASTSGTGNALDVFINSVYENLFGHTADGTDTTGGLGYWRTQVLNALTTRNPATIANELGAFGLQVASGAQNVDQTTLANKVTVADFLTELLIDDNIPYGNSGGTVDQLAHTAIASVTASAASVTAAEVTITGVIHSLI